MKRTGSSETVTALHFGITNPTIIGSWKKVFLEGKEGGLNIKEGLPCLISFRGRVFKKVASFSDGPEGLFRKAQAAISFELKEEFKLKDILT
jgi:hypothetical protein